MFVQKLCLNIIVIVEFHATCVFIKDMLSKAVLAKGKVNGGFYSLDGIIHLSPMSSIIPLLLMVYVILFLPLV